MSPTNLSLLIGYTPNSSFMSISQIKSLCHEYYGMKPLPSGEILGASIFIAEDNLLHKAY